MMISEDSVHGKFKHDVKIGEKDELIVNGNKIKQLGSVAFLLKSVGSNNARRCIQASREGPKALPWKELLLLKPSRLTIPTS